MSKTDIQEQITNLFFMNVKKTKRLQMIINKINNNFKYNKNNNKHPIHIKSQYYNQDIVSFSGKKDKDTRPLLETFMYTIGLCYSTTPLHEAQNAEQTKKILEPIKRDKELRDILLYDDENCSLPIHLAKDAEQTKVLLEASPSEKILTKQLLAENNEREIPLHLAKDIEQTKVLLDASPNEDVLTKQLLYKGIEKYIPLHYAKSPEQIKALLEASPDIDIKVMQLMAKACDGSLPIHMAQTSKQKEALLNAAPNDRIKYQQLVALDEEGNPPVDGFDDACVRTAYELATTSDQLTELEKDDLLATYVNYVKDPYFSEQYMNEYNKSIKEFLEKE